MIWYKNYAIEELTDFCAQTMLSHLDIRFDQIGVDFLKGSMPVDHRTVQPARILHGGASVTLAESLGSIASHMCIDTTKFMTVGLSINANHIRSLSEGTGRVTGICKPIHLGKSTHIWEIELLGPDLKKTCISRLTTVVLPKKC